MSDWWKDSEVVEPATVATMDTPESEGNWWESSEVVEPAQPEPVQPLIDPPPDRPRTIPRATAAELGDPPAPVGARNTGGKSKLYSQEEIDRYSSPEMGPEQNFVTHGGDIVPQQPTNEEDLLKGILDGSIKVPYPESRDGESYQDFKKRITDYQELQDLVSDYNLKRMQGQVYGQEQPQQPDPEQAAAEAEVEAEMEIIDVLEQAPQEEPPLQDYYGYPVRQPDRGEDDYFRQNPDVAGMATEDNQITLNPYSTNSPEQQEAVARNEAIRLWMDDNEIDPSFAVTSQQRKAFAGTEYAKPENISHLRKTILARYLTGDASSGKLTPEQKKWADHVQSQLPNRQQEPSLEEGLTPGELESLTPEDIAGLGGGMQEPETPPQGVDMISHIRESVDSAYLTGALKMGKPKYPLKGSGALYSKEVKPELREKEASFRAKHFRRSVEEQFANNPAALEQMAGEVEPEEISDEDADKRYKKFMEAYAYAKMFVDGEGNDEDAIIIANSVGDQELEGMILYAVQDLASEQKKHGVFKQAARNVSRGAGEMAPVLKGKGKFRQIMGEDGRIEKLTDDQDAREMFRGNIKSAYDAEQSLNPYNWYDPRGWMLGAANMAPRMYLMGRGARAVGAGAKAAGLGKAATWGAQASAVTAMGVGIDTRQMRIRMMQAGVGGEAARKYAEAYGPVYSAIEGIIPDPFEFGGQAVLRRVIGGRLLEFGGKIAGESTEEGLQEFTEGMATQLAEQYQGTRDKLDVKKELIASLEAARDSFGPLLLTMGGGGVQAAVEDSVTFKRWITNPELSIPQAAAGMKVLKEPISPLAGVVWAAENADKAESLFKKAPEVNGKKRPTRPQWRKAGLPPAEKEVREQFVADLSKTTPEERKQRAADLKRLQELREQQASADSESVGPEVRDEAEVQAEQEIAAALGLDDAASRELDEEFKSEALAEEGTPDVQFTSGVESAPPEPTTPPTQPVPGKSAESDEVDEFLDDEFASLDDMAIGATFRDSMTEAQEKGRTLEEWAETQGVTRLRDIDRQAWDRVAAERTPAAPTGEAAARLQELEKEKAKLEAEPEWSSISRRRRKRNRLLEIEQEMRKLRESTPPPGPTQEDGSTGEAAVSEAAADLDLVAEDLTHEEEFSTYTPEDIRAAVTWMTADEREEARTATKERQHELIVEAFRRSESDDVGAIDIDAASEEAAVTPEAAPETPSDAVPPRATPQPESTQKAAEEAPAAPEVAIPDDMPSLRELAKSFDPPVRTTGKGRTKAAIQEEIRQRQAEAKKAKPAPKKPVEFYDPRSDGRYYGAVISPSAKKKGKWQVTYFDKDGFSSDTTYDTEEEARRNIEREGLKPAKESKLEAFSKTEEWRVGNEKTHVIGWINELGYLKDKDPNKVFEAYEKGGLSAAKKVFMERKAALERDSRARRVEQVRKSFNLTPEQSEIAVLLHDITAFGRERFDIAEPGTPIPKGAQEQAGRTYVDIGHSPDAIQDGNVQLWLHPGGGRKLEVKDVTEWGQSHEDDNMFGGRTASAINGRIDHGAKQISVVNPSTEPYAEKQTEQVVKRLRQKYHGYEVVDFSQEIYGEPVLFQDVPRWYSKARTLVEQKMGPKASPHQVLQMLKKNGVKAEELQWSGLEELLGGDKAGKSITKAEVLEAIDRGMRIEEVVKGNAPKIEWTKEEEESGENPQWRGEELSGLYSGDFLIEEVDGEFHVESGSAADLGRFDSLDEAKAAALQRAHEDSEGATTAPDDTKHSRWVLPGGENYQELLLTLPAKSSRIADSEYRVEEMAYDDGSVRYFAVTPNYRSKAYRTRAEAESVLEDRPRFEDDADAKNQQYTGSHWDEPNVVVHIRMNERTDADGKKVLFLEEIQSDWHQEGRKKGYAPAKPELPAGFSIVKEQKVVKYGPDHKKTFDIWRVVDSDGSTRGEDGKKYGNGRTREDALASWRLKQGYNPGQFVPDAPFKKTWPMLAMKRAIQYAAENGFDRISWTTGEQQAARYDLSKQVDRIVVTPRTDAETGERTRSVALELTGGSVLQLGVNADGIVDNTGQAQGFEEAKGKHLSDVVGKELAERLLQTERGTFEGDDLKVGGEGMKSFYDKMLPNEVNKFIKKFGAKVGRTEIGTEEEMAGRWDGPDVSLEDARKVLLAAQEPSGDVFESHLSGELNPYDIPPLNTAAMAGQAADVVSRMEGGESFASAMSQQSTALGRYFGGQVEHTPQMAKSQQPSFDITPKMRESAQKQGQPLFQDRQKRQGTVKGWTHFVNAAKALVGGTEHADISTWIHEFAHPMAEYLFVNGRALSQEERGNITVEDIEKMEAFCFDPKNWRGGRKGAKRTDTWDRDAKEAFADAWETFWMTGKAPESAPELEGIFAKIAAWMADVYGQLKQLVKLTPEVRKVFDKVVQRGKLPAGVVVKAPAKKPSARDKFRSKRGKKPSARDKFRGRRTPTKAPAEEPFGLERRTTSQPRLVDTEADIAARRSARASLLRSRAIAAARRGELGAAPGSVSPGRWRGMVRMAARRAGVEADPLMFVNVKVEKTTSKVRGRKGGVSKKDTDKLLRLEKKREKLTEAGADTAKIDDQIKTLSEQTGTSGGRVGWTVSGIPKEVADATGQKYKPLGKSGKYYFYEDPTPALRGMAQDVQEEATLTAKAEERGNVLTSIAEFSPAQKEAYERERQHWQGQYEAEFEQQLRRQEALRVAIRKTGLDANDVRRVENNGIDYSVDPKMQPQEIQDRFPKLLGKLRSYDQYAEDLASEFPDVIDASDASASLWDLLSSREPPPPSFDEYFEDNAAEAIEALREQGDISFDVSSFDQDPAGGETFHQTPPSGEFWLQGGTSTFADGDIGDYNHEAVVLEGLQYEAAEILGIDESEIGDWIDSNDDMSPLVEGGMSEAAVEALVNPGADVRGYAMEHEGWARLADGNVELYGLTNSTLDDIASGLWDAYGEDAESSRFTIEDHKTGKVYVDVPYQVIADARVAKLRDYDLSSGNTLYQEEDDIRLLADIATEENIKADTFEAWAEKMRDGIGRDIEVSNEELKAAWDMLHPAEEAAAEPAPAIDLLSEDEEAAREADEKFKGELPTGSRVTGVREPPSPIPPKETPSAGLTDYELTGLAKAVMNDLREIANIPELESTPAETVREWVAQAESAMAQDPAAAQRIVNELAANPTRALDHHEATLLAFHYRKLANDAEPAFQALVAAAESGDDATIAEARTAFIKARQPMEEFEELLNVTKGTWGRTGVALQVLLRKDFSEAGLLRRAREANHGRELSPEQHAEMVEMARQMAELQKQLDEVTAERDKLAVEKASRKQHKRAKNDASKTRRRQPTTQERKTLKGAWDKFGQVEGVDVLFQAGKAQGLEAAEDVVQAYRNMGVWSFAELRRHIAERIGAEQEAEKLDLFQQAWWNTQPATELSDVWEEPADMSDLAALTRESRRIQRALLEADINMPREEVIDAVHEEMIRKNIVTDAFTRSQTMAALSRYGQFETQSQETVAKTQREMNAEVLKLRQIEQLEAALKRVEELKAQGLSEEEIGNRLVEENVLPSATGLVRDKPGKIVRQLTKIYNEKKKGVPASTESRAGMLQTAADAIIRGLINRINDLNWEINSKKRMVREKRDRPTSDEIKRLEAERDRLMKIHRSIPELQLPRKKLTPAQKLAAAEKATEKMLEALQRDESLGFPATEKTEPVTSPKLEALKKKVAKVRDRRRMAERHAETAGGGRRIQALDKHIAQLEERIKKEKQGLDTREVGDPAERLSMQEAAREAFRMQLQAELRKLRTANETQSTKDERARKSYMANLMRRIAEYNKMLIEGETDPEVFAPKEKKEPRTLSKEELDLKRKWEDKRHQALQKMAEYHLAHLNKFEWTVDKIVETAHLSRAIMTSFDLSALLRQGGLASFAHPILAKRALTGTLMSIAGNIDPSKLGAFKGGVTMANLKEFLSTIDSRTAEFDFMHALTQGADGELMLQSGLALTGSDEAITRQEEAFQGRFGKYVPGVSLSARLYTMMLNKLRADLFKLMVNRLGRNGEVSPSEAKLIANYVNVATGRSGGMSSGKLAKWSAVLNTVFFAPRYVASRFQYLAMPFYLPFKGGVSKDWRAKRAVYREMSQTALGYGTFFGSIALASMLFYDDDDEDKPFVELNPLSSDFLKIRIGETRLDPMAGLSQPFVFLSRFGAGRTKSSVTGRITKFGEGWKPTTRADLILRLVRTKMAPVPGAIWTATDNWTNVVGQKEDRLLGMQVHPAIGTIGGILRPLALGEVGETMRHQGVSNGSALSLLAILGMGIGTYGPETEWIEGTDEEREKQFKDDLKKMTWQDKTLPYQDLLTTEQVEQVATKADNKKWSMVYGIGDVPVRRGEDRKNKARGYLKEEDYKEAVAKREEDLVKFQDFKAEVAPTLEDAEKLLRDYYETPQVDGGKGKDSDPEAKGSIYVNNSTKDSYKHRLDELRRLYAD